MTSLSDLNFLRSAQELDSSRFPLSGFDQWFQQGSKRHKFHIEQIPFARLQKWGFDRTTGSLCHESGKFFSIEGIGVETNFGGINSWEQPIINQPEVGFLGIIAKQINGCLLYTSDAADE